MQPLSRDSLDHRSGNGLVAPMDFLRLPLIAVIGFMLYNETFDPWTILGAVLVVAGNIINIRTSKRPA